MAPVQRRLSVGWHRRTRRDARLWMLAALLLVIAVVVWTAYAAALPVFSSPSLPWWAFAIAFFITARLASMDSPRRGTQAITLAAAPFVVGLFHATPPALLGGYAVGIALAAATRRPWAIWQSAFEIVRFAVFVALGIWVFRLISGPPTLPVWRSAFGAIAATAIVVFRTGDIGGRGVPPARARFLDRPSPITSGRPTWPPSRRRASD